MNYLQDFSEKELTLGARYIFSKIKSGQKRNAKAIQIQSVELGEDKKTLRLEDNQLALEHPKAVYLPILKEIEYCQETLEAEESIFHYDKLLSVLREFNQIAFEIQNSFYELSMEDQALEIEKFTAEFSSVRKVEENKRSYIKKMEDERLKQVNKRGNLIETKVFVVSSSNFSTEFERLPNKPYEQMIEELTEKINKWNEGKDVDVVNISFESKKKYNDSIHLAESYGSYKSINLKEDFETVYATVVFKNRTNIY